MSIIIDPDGDYTVQVWEMEDVLDANGKWSHIKKREAAFVVSSTTLAETSRYFEARFRNKSGKSHDSKSCLTKVRSISSMETWLRVSHGEIPDNEVDLAQIWHVLLVAWDHGFEVRKLGGWFAAWYAQQPIEIWLRNWDPKKAYNDLMRNPCCLLFPLWRFDHAAGFLRITRFLAYNAVSQIEEFKPIKAWDIHLPIEVMQQLRAARGRLKTILFSGLYGHIEGLLKAEQQCCDDTSCSFQRALLALEIWPLEKWYGKKHMNEILDTLDKFRYVREGDKCKNCCRDYTPLVQEVTKFVREYFSGLCLDCLDASNPKTESADKDYWMHSRLRQWEWVHGCRVKKHKQPTWYFSFLGRRDDMRRRLGQLDFAAGLYENKKRRLRREWGRDDWDVDERAPGEGWDGSQGPRVNMPGAEKTEDPWGSEEDTMIGTHEAAASKNEKEIQELPISTSEVKEVEQAIDALEVESSWSSTVDTVAW